MCMKDYILPQKANFKKIELSKLNLKTPNLKNTDESKAVTIAKWMMSWMDELVKNKTIHYGELLPTKDEFAYFLGVSIGTIQNSLRYIEDRGYVESKQRIGTILKDRKNNSIKFRKLTSKREMAISEIKKFIQSSKYKIGTILPSARTLGALIGCSPNTTRLALEYLTTIGILDHISNERNDSKWALMSLNFSVDEDSENGEHQTLVNKIVTDLKNYINENLNVGDRIPSHFELSNMFKVSIKTMHDALKALIEEEILLARRGRYGTTVIRLPKDNNTYKKLEKSIFAPAKDTAFYYYEKTQNAIKTMIAENYEVGEKLPSIMEMSSKLDISPNTIRKAFQNLAKEGYLVFSRGRYGGTFVVEKPESGEETFKWLSVTPQYAKAYSN